MRFSTLKSDTVCPCGSGRPYGSCCERLHKNPALPNATPEDLMRSRYSAFVLGLSDYLLDTWQAGKRPATIDADPARQWLGLRVVRATTGHDGNSAVVEFVARSRLPGKRADRLHEVSRFVREQGRWFYVDGDVAPPG